MAFPSMIKLSAVVAFFAAGAFSLALSSENTVDVLEKRQAATSIPVLYCTDANFGGECKVDRIPVGTCFNFLGDHVRYNDVVSSFANLDENSGACVFFTDYFCLGSRDTRQKDMDLPASDSAGGRQFNDAFSSLRCGPV